MLSSNKSYSNSTPQFPASNVGINVARVCIIYNNKSTGNTHPLSNVCNLRTKHIHVIDAHTHTQPSIHPPTDPPTHRPLQLPPSLDVLARKLNTEKRATETWGYQILPTLYSVYQKVEKNIRRSNWRNAERKTAASIWFSIFILWFQRVSVQFSCLRFFMSF